MTLHRTAVTGSQALGEPWRPFIWGRIDERWHLTRPGDEFVLRHGGAALGADAYAHAWAQARIAAPDPRYAIVREEIVAADWAVCDPASKACQPVKKDGKPHRRPNPGWPHAPTRGHLPDYCPAAGHRRNPDVPCHPDYPVDCLLAFILDESPGATATLKAARDAGVPNDAVERYSRKHVPRKPLRRR